MRFNRSASPFGVEDDHDLVLPPTLRRMSCVMNSSARRVLPTRVVPSTSEWPTRSASGRRDVDLVRLDAVQARHSADRRQRTRRVERAVPGQRLRQFRDGYGANSRRSSMRRAPGRSPSARRSGGTPAGRSASAGACGAGPSESPGRRTAVAGSPAHRGWSSRSAAGAGCCAGSAGWPRRRGSGCAEGEKASALPRPSNGAQRERPRATRHRIAAPTDRDGV